MAAWKERWEVVEFSLQWADSYPATSSAGSWSPGWHVSISYVFSLFAPTRSLNLYLRVAVNTSESGDWVGQRWPGAPVCLQVQTNSFCQFVVSCFLPSRMAPNSTLSSKPPFNSNQHFLPSLPPQLTRLTISLIYWPNCILFLCSVWWIAHSDI